MASGRILTTNFTTRLVTKYTNTGDLINPTNVKDNLRYLDILKKFTDGIGTDKANLQHYSRRRLVNSTESINLDGDLTNRWGDSLNFEDIKLGIIFNREEVRSNRFLQVNFKNETYYIGPQGFRIFYESLVGGVLDISSSGVIAEGNLVLSSNADVSFDLILIGSGGSIVPGYALWLDAETTVYQGGSQTPAIDGDLVQEWVDKSSNSHIFAQTTTAKKPIFRENSINGQPAIEFDGTDDLLIKASAFLTGSKGSAFIVYNLSSPKQNSETLLSLGDEGGGAQFQSFKAIRVALVSNIISAISGGIINSVDGNITQVLTNTNLAVFINDGNKYRLRLNGIEEVLTLNSGTSGGSWWADITNPDNVVVGARFINAIESQFFFGLIGTILVYDDVDLTDADIDENEAALAGKYGITLT